MPQESELRTEAVDCRRDDSQILRDQRQVPERRLHLAEQGGSGATMPAALPWVARPGRDRPVGDEPAKVVHARDVDQLERPPEALDPPAVALPPHRRPVVHRLPPELAVRMGYVRCRSGDEPRREEVRMRFDVRAVLGDVNRDVPDQPDAPLRRVPP